MKKSTAKIAYMYASAEKFNGDTNTALQPTSFFFLPTESNDINLTIEFGFVGLVDDCNYTFLTRFFHDGVEVGYPNSIEEANKINAFFAKSGEYAINFSSSEKFIAKNSGYYKIESILYEYEDEYDDKAQKTLLCEDNIVHKSDIYVAVASEWSD